MIELDYEALGIDAQEYMHIPIFVPRDLYDKFVEEGGDRDEFKDFFAEGLKNETILHSILLPGKGPVKIKQAAYDKLPEERKKEYDIFIRLETYKLIP